MIDADINLGENSRWQNSSWFGPLAAVQGNAGTHRSTAESALTTTEDMHSDWPRISLRSALIYVATEMQFRGLFTTAHGIGQMFGPIDGYDLEMGH
ncbi:hypothetical protein [Algicella marina]|uniref:Uncharacterized protein n=1 Tax=Algicella marina TaxID=2683284 RepID=A0A6P1T2S0_9RHOB|nr:hypothetical protein [Algicella marina]QHQ35766.1 hypothetical protein GO499_11560 [Algicella marina]